MIYVQIFESTRINNKAGLKELDMKPNPEADKHLACQSFVTNNFHEWRMAIYCFLVNWTRLKLWIFERLRIHKLSNSTVTSRICDRRGNCCFEYLENFFPLAIVMKDRSTRRSSSSGTRSYRSSRLRQGGGGSSQLRSYVFYQFIRWIQTIKGFQQHICWFSIFQKGLHLQKWWFGQSYE